MHRRERWERESEAQSDVRTRKRAGGRWQWGRGGWGGARFFALTSDWASLSRSSSFSSMQRSIAISLSMFCVVNGRFEKLLFALLICALKSRSPLKTDRDCTTKCALKSRSPLKVDQKSDPVDLLLSAGVYKLFPKQNIKFDTNIT